MLKSIRNYWRRREQARMFYPSIREIVDVTLKNRRSYCMDKYGRWFNEDDIKNIQLDIECEVRPYDSSCKIIDTVLNIIERYESSLASRTKAAIAEYGI